MSETKKESIVRFSPTTSKAFHIKISKIGVASLLLTSLGVIALITSVTYSSSILAFIGLGLTFWGILALYIGTEKYVKQTLLGPSIVPSLIDLNQLLTELKYEGNGIYIPLTYFKGIQTSRVYIPKKKDAKAPTPREIQQKEDKMFLKNPDAALIIAPGSSLLKLFEKTLGTSFTKVDLEYLQQKLPKLFTEDLKIAEDLKIQIKTSKFAQEVANSVSVFQLKNDMVYVRITNPIYQDLCKDARKLGHICGSIGCPACSAIACALTETSGKPVTIEKTESQEDGKAIEVLYRILEE